MKALELLEEIKNNEVQYAIVDDKGAVYCNRNTDNIMDVYGFADDKNGHFYGVYGDAVDGQIDSRSTSDNEILKAIEFMLKLGEVVKRSELNFADLKRTYYQGKIIQEARIQRLAIQEYGEWLKNNKELVSGTIIKHVTLGKGKVVKVENINKPELAIIYIDFENKGEKQLMLAYLIENDLIEVL